MLNVSREIFHVKYLQHQAESVARDELLTELSRSTTRKIHWHDT